MFILSATFLGLLIIRFAITGKGVMIMKLHFDLNQFNLREFLEDSKTNGQELMTQNVMSLDSPGDVVFDESKSESAVELYEQLINNGKYVYVNFSSNAMDEELECIDGNTYLYLNEEEAEEYFEEEEMLEGFQPYENLQIYEDSSVGYLLKYEDQTVHIQSAIIHTLDSSIEVVDDVELLNKPMESYLNKYIVHD
jgi:hypothetical protein